KTLAETYLQQECNLSPTPDTVEKAVAAAAPDMVKLGTRNHGHRTVTWKGATPCGSFWTLTFKGINNEKLDGYQDRRCGRLRCAGWLHRPEAAAGGYRQPEEPGGHAVLRRG